MIFQEVKTPDRAYVLEFRSALRARPELADMLKANNLSERSIDGVIEESISRTLTRDYCVKVETDWSGHHLAVTNSTLHEIEKIAGPLCRGMLASSRILDSIYNDHETTDIAMTVRVRGARVVMRVSAHPSQQFSV